MSNIVRMCDISFDRDLFENYLTNTVLDRDLFENYLTNTVLDRLLCSYNGLPKGVNYMIIGDPGTGKTTIILDMLAKSKPLQGKSLEAIQTQVSLRELKIVHGYLGGRKVDLPDTEVSSITRYRDNLRRFSERHQDVKGIEERVKTDVSWWDLYNRMTEFATHSNALDQDDARRGLILNYATGQLFKTHDIISYIE